jgi:L-lysine 2,3-aminomutase
MIAAKQSNVRDPNADWKAQWRDSFTDIDELLRFLQLHPAMLKVDRNQRFTLRVPRSFVMRMQMGNPNCPLLRQILPLDQENQVVSGFDADPVQDQRYSPTPGVIHKYTSRALWIAAGTCAVNCRYCFRREFPYAQAHMRPNAIAAALEHLDANPTINEVILSGGDPLALDNDKLSRLFDAIKTRPQIRRVRLHTRTPIVLPARVDQELLGELAALPWPVIMVLHSNHANEWLDDELQAKVLALRTIGVHLYNQAVLLAGVNDSADAQIALSETLFAAGVQPYYLNLLDPVRGSAHFAVDDSRAKAIFADMQARLPGFLVPKLVRDVPGRDAKTLLLAS